MDKKTASFTGNVIEFRPGDKVIQIFPVARPLIGLVVGSNKVEGKVYVNWNGRTIQVDPEEIQLATGIPFFPISRNASTNSEQNKLSSVIDALVKSGDPIKTANFKSEFIKNLEENGISNEEANDISYSYEDGFNKRLNANCLDPVIPMSGEIVVILNDGGSKAGYTGILVDVENQDAIIDLTSGWSPVSNGSNLLRVPLSAVVPIDSPMRETMSSQYPGLTASISENKPEEKRVACRGFNLFLDNIKTIDVFDNKDFKAWIQTSISPENEVIVSAVIERGGNIDPLTVRYPIFKQTLNGFNNIQNKTDFDNAIQRISALVDNCRSTILQYFRNNIIPEYVEEEFKRSLQKEKCVIVVASDKATPKEIQDFTDAYIAAMLWSSLDDNDEPLDRNYDKESLSKEFMDQTKKDCEKFINENYKYLKTDIKNAGHDFWLTRVGHGAGFWAGDWEFDVDGENAGNKLTENSKKFREIDVLVDDFDEVVGY